MMTECALKTCSVAAGLREIAESASFLHFQLNTAQILMPRKRNIFSTIVNFAMEQLEELSVCFKINNDILSLKFQLRNRVIQ